jgi:hypothetical protein
VVGTQPRQETACSKRRPRCKIKHEIASKEVGVATLEELQRQLAVIQNIEKETD